VNYGSFGILEVQASILTRYPLISHFIDYDSILALVFMYCISCLISFIALCYAWPTLRGRWTCWTLGHCFYITTCYYSDLSVTCILLTHVYHLTSSVLLLDQLACHHLVRPDCYVMIDPAHSTFIVMFYCLLDITTLSCYPLNQA